MQFFNLVRTQFKKFICAAFGVMFAGTLSAATLADVTIDRSTALLSGSGFLSDAGASISVAGLGATMVDPLTGDTFFPSMSIVKTGGGTVSFDDLTSFPPSSFLSGSIDDLFEGSGILTALVSETGTGDLFAIDVLSAAIAGFGKIILFPDPATTIRVYGADLIGNPNVIPLPAAGLLLVSGVFVLGRIGRRRR